MGYCLSIKDNKGEKKDSVGFYTYLSESNNSYYPDGSKGNSERYSTAAYILFTF